MNLPKDLKALSVPTKARFALASDRFTSARRQKAWQQCMKAQLVFLIPELVLVDG